MLQIYNVNSEIPPLFASNAYRRPMRVVYTRYCPAWVLIGVLPPLSCVAFVPRFI